MDDGVLNVLLVDDEQLALKFLKSVLESFPNIKVAKTCRNGREAVSALRHMQFDAIFLDVQMPGLDGFGVIENTQSDVLPPVVFATAYDEFACKAFDYHAVDYIMKPLDAKRVEVAVDRIRTRISTQMILDNQPDSNKGRVMGAIQDIKQRGGHAPMDSFDAKRARLPIKDGDTTTLLNFDDIDWIDAAGDYMCVHADGTTFILRSTMKELEKRLSAQFVRIHRSTIVNLEKVGSVQALPKGECLLHLDNEVSLKVSRNFRVGVKHLLT
jgi:two-component system LytT family response regulator